MKRTIASALLFLLSVSLAISAEVASDPGPRGEPLGAGEFFPKINAAVLAGAQDGKNRFSETETFPGGLGPWYNSGPTGACSACHSQPAMGGSSPSASVYPFIGQNPQATVDFNAYGATNTVPSFITPNGPVREARFVLFPDGTPDGGVHDLFSVTGRTDAPTCTLAQPNFAQQFAAGNVIFRIPLPVFGDGLIENIDDATILANQTADPEMKTALGIHGHPNRTSNDGASGHSNISGSDPSSAQPNRSGNDGTITRFGWKAQNKSLLMFAGEAYNVEVGVTNELFPTERPEPGHPLPAGCKTHATPEDTSNPRLTGPAVNSDITAFASFMRMLDQPKPAPPTPSTLRGRALFSQAGCVLCHTPSMVTQPSTFDPALSNAQANLFSDLLVHNMGTGLADGVTQGSANGQEFRTAPLWGIGQRIFFLHDGRTSDLLQAIEAHSSSGSEASGSITLFNQLSPSQQQDLLNFLRSL
jgi:mono/diheme cytochrome c family protein